MPNKKDGGWILPAEIDPPRRCLCIPVPDEPAHRQAFFGALIQLGWQFNWQRDVDHKAVPVSVLWNEIVLEAMARFYSGVDYMCFSCEQLQECLQPLLDAQTAQFQQMLDMSKYGTDARPGVPMTPTQRGTDLAAGTNPGCDLDVTWAQSLQTVKYGDDLIRSALALAESATNDTELAGVISSLPGLDEIGVDAIFGYIDLLLEGIAENYAAQYTTEYEEDTACAIFCLAKADCVITADMIYIVFLDRVTARFGDPVEAFITVTDLMAYLVDQDIDGTIIADVLMLVVFGGGVLAQLFLGDVGTKPLELVLKLAVDDASSDWELLCTDCPECTELDFATSDYSSILELLFGTWESGTGFVGECFFSAPYYYHGVQIDGNLSGINDVVSMVIRISAPTQGGTPGAQYFLEIDGLGIVDEQDNVDGTITLVYSGSQIDAPVFFIGAYSWRDATGCVGDPPVILSLEYCTMAEA